MGLAQSKARKEGKEIVRRRLEAAVAKRKAHDEAVRNASARGMRPPVPAKGRRPSYPDRY